jgi:hypothetical protein
LAWGDAIFCSRDIMKNIRQSDGVEHPSLNSPQLR